MLEYAAIGQPTMHWDGFDYQLRPANGLMRQGPSGMPGRIGSALHLTRALWLAWAFDFVA